MNAVKDLVPAGQFLLGKTTEGRSIALNLAMANRHGLVTGATGTGKTVTLQLMAENFSRGRPCIYGRHQGRPVGNR